MEYRAGRLLQAAIAFPSELKRLVAKTSRTVNASVTTITIAINTLNKRFLNILNS
jgi:hypothetical protein